MSQQEAEKARKEYVTKVNKVKNAGVAELKSEVASNLTDSMELLGSIKATTRRNENKEPFLVQFRFAPHGLFQQLGVSGQFGRIGYRGPSGDFIKSTTGMKKTHWFDSAYDKYKLQLADAAENYHALKVVAVVDFSDGATRYNTGRGGRTS